MNNLKVQVIQMSVTSDKESNLSRVKYFVENQDKNVDMIVLPEMFICPYDSSVFANYSEEKGGKTWRELSNIARENNAYLVAGSVPEKAEGKIYNTSYVFDRDGVEIGKHRKVHLFDIDIEGGQKFKESDSLCPGNQVTFFDTEFARIGLCICYDIRFPELSRLMADEGVKMIIVPAAFNMSTGPKHWDLLFKARAVDNQVYMLGASQARNELGPYVSWGHSLIVSPFGEILKQLDEKEGSFVFEIDFSIVDEVRTQLPLLKHRRHDMYSLILNSK